MGVGMDDGLVSYFLILLLCGVIVLPFLHYFMKRGSDLFEPIYWASGYFFLLFVIRPIFDLTIGSVFLGVPPFDEETGHAFNLALLLLIPCFLMFLLGYYSRIGGIVAGTLPRMPQAWNNRRLVLGLPLIILVGIISFLLLVQSFGGWSTYISGKQETLTAPGQGYYLLGVSFIPIAYTAALTHALLYRKWMFFVFFIFLPLVLIMGMTSGSKGNFLVPILITLVSINYLKKKIRLKKIIIFALFVVLSIPVFNIYRHLTNISDVSDIAGEGSNAFSNLDVNETTKHVMSRFYGIDSLTYIIRDTPDVMDYQYGGTVLPIVVAWIPRSMWEGKPIISFGKIFAETYYQDYFSGTGTSASPTVIGEAYINWHVPGMLVVSLLCGVIIRAVYIYLICRNFGAPSVFVYSQLLLFLFIFWESSIAGLVAKILSLLVVWVAIIAVMGGRRKV